MDPALSIRRHRGAARPAQDAALEPPSPGLLVEAAICEMRRNHRRWGPRTLAYWLGQNGIDPVPARSTIYRVLVRNHLIVPVPRKRKRDSYMRWEREAPMELWQHDFTSGCASSPVVSSRW